MMREQLKIDRFKEQVLTKYNIYNSLFMTLPYEDVYSTGTLLPLFLDFSVKGYKNNQNPSHIVEGFFNKFLGEISQEDKEYLLFKFIQYIERQIVLFDAIEDAAYTIVNNMNGLGTLRNLKSEAESRNLTLELKEKLKQCSIRTVLTAHPTQFYPDSVLGIIIDLVEAIETNNLSDIEILLSQLGKTPFFNKSKPTPYDEAESLIWYLENIFYTSVSKIHNYIYHNIFEGQTFPGKIVKLGFWPGGDRDGNPFVTPKITKQVGDALRTSILKCYYRDIKALKKRLTFRGVDTIISELKIQLYHTIFSSKANDYKPITLTEFQNKLQEVSRILIKKHRGIYLELVEDIINKVNTFGFHFASLDIRQDSRVNHAAMSSIIEVLKKEDYSFPNDYEVLSEAQKVDALSKVNGILNPKSLKDESAQKTLNSIYAMKYIQRVNGELGANRYIISNNQTTLNMMEVFTMVRLCDWTNPTVDIVPLFETVNDLKSANKVMQGSYENKSYMTHLKSREMTQHIMLGFSDGTKDGGYLTANWAIYTAKENLTEVSRRFGVKVIFFDGRGGPPARGGGKTHQFYASLGQSIESDHVQVTVQGQTISSNFGTIDSCKFNLEQLLSATIKSDLFSINNDLSPEDRKTMQALSDISYKSYKDFKNHPKFIPYLEQMSVLKYYGKTNIGSRPTKRGTSEKFEFSDLRAIPFVASWSQLKQNVPGFYGFGTSISFFDEKGDFDKVKRLYDNSLFFRTLVENAMMSLTKSFFKLTAYMKEDEEFGEFWTTIYQEYKLTKKMLLKVTGYKKLMENMTSGKISIKIREKIVLPLLTIQQYALQELQKMNSGTIPTDERKIKVYEKIVTRSLFGNTNASRNSA